jgi:acetyl-CoA carboxylase biotin carboxyl carrier protein
VDLKDIKKIVELMNEHELSYFHLEQGEFNLKLKKGPDADSIAALMSAIPQIAPMQSYSQPPAAPQAVAPATILDPPPGVSGVSDGDPFTSPMVGTFYRKQSPDAENFVEIGSSVKEGQTLCIIEAMKVMNEIKAETSGTIATILADDGTAVQFGDTLFTIK